MITQALRTLLLAAVTVAASGPAMAAAPDPNAIFARVDDTPIRVGEFAQALQAEARRTYYHGAPPAEKLPEFQQQVADRLVEQVLVQQEGIRRGLCQGQPRTALDDAVQADACRARLQAVLEKTLQEPTEKELRAYYKAHPELFTEPTRERVSLILLAVAPSAAPAAWQAAYERAQALREQIVQGTSFAALAREHSDDASAAKGGDMGYLHEGMLGALARDAVAELKPGELSNPTQLLEGVALLKLHERHGGALSPFKSVRTRVEGLYEKARRESAWEELVKKLRAGARVVVEQQYLTPQGPQVQ